MHVDLKAGITAVLVGLLVLTGCRTVNKNLSERVLDPDKATAWSIHYGSEDCFVLDDDRLAQVEFAGWAEADRVRVHYPLGLAESAQCIADRTSSMLGEVEQRLGITITTCPRIELLRLDEIPQSFDIRLESEPNVFPLPMFVQDGQESCDSILAQCRSYPYILVHELVETSMTCSGANGRVLPDVGWNFLFLGAHFDNDTRWFRDGLANYAGYVAYQTIHEDLDPSGEPLAGRELIHDKPFSALEQVGEKLFSWSQYSRAKQQDDYYSAALGLFLLIENEYGEQAIRDINAAIASRDGVDGRDLLEIAREVTGADLKEVVADFRFPRFGMAVANMTSTIALNKGLDVDEGLFVAAVEPNGLAATAGIEPNEVIVAVNGTGISDFLDYQLAVFKARRDQTVSLSIWKADAGVTSMELALQQSLAQEPRKRTSLTTGGRTDFVTISMH